MECIHKKPTGVSADTPVGSCVLDAPGGWAGRPGLDGGAIVSFEVALGDGDGERRGEPCLGCERSFGCIKSIKGGRPTIIIAPEISLRELCLTKARVTW